MNIKLILKILLVIAVIMAFIFVNKNKDFIKEKHDSLNNKVVLKHLVGDIESFTPVINEYFVYYNKKDYGYICKNMMSKQTKKQYNKKQCVKAIEEIYDYFGEEVSYNMEDAKISKEIRNGEIKYSLELPTNYKNHDYTTSNIKIISNRGETLKLLSVSVSYENK